MSELPVISHPNLLVGIETNDDAGVYKLSHDVALVQSLDFITPIVDDPYHFGRIAAANALSDVYAMGGRPLTAMNIVCFPVTEMPKEILKEILQGGLEKIHEADACLHELRNEGVQSAAVIGEVIGPHQKGKLHVS